MFGRLHIALLLAVMVAAEIPAPDALANPPENPYAAKPLPRTGPKPPWPRRRRLNVKGMKGRGQGLVDLKRWPAEPSPPASVDEKTFALALRELCHDWMPPKRPFRYAKWILEYSKEFAVDPFLLAALIYRQSRCIPRQSRPSDYGVGLAMINARMHGAFIRKRRYKYWVLDGGSWKEQELKIDRYPLVRGNLRRSQPSIYFAAAFLSIWKRQCPALDRAFGSVPHRHFVSHFMWGDRVRGAGAEDRVLRARRRLIQSYTKATPPAKGKFKDLALLCPLDAPPRKVSSRMGEDRSGGARRHKGVDFSSTWGEPVRAVADGKVYFAGVARKGAIGRRVSPEEIGSLDRKAMGPGGLFVMIRHKGGLVSGYMHLSSYVVKSGQPVKAGDMVGRVGRTGIKSSGPHLHFELRHNGRHIDPVPHLKPHVFVPQDTHRGRVLIAEQKRIRRRRRVKRWRDYKA